MCLNKKVKGGAMFQFGFTFVLGFFILDVIIIISGDSKLPVYATDTCDETGRKAIACGAKRVIKILDVRLMPHNYTCVEKEEVAKLCDGLNTCSFVDLRKQLYYYCKDSDYKQVYTSFECVPTTEDTTCRTNICSEDNPSIKCRRGSVFHLLGAKCFSMRQDCPRKVFVTIYRSCEGKRTCALSVLRSEIPHSICNDDLFRQQNLFMDYICVDTSTVTSNCDVGTYIKQEPRFGILQNPGYPDNPNGNPKGCYWAIYTESDHKEIEVTIHEAYSVEGLHVCETQNLQIQYTLCSSKQLTMEKFCNENRVNVRIRSCGTVYVTHYKYLAGKDRGSRFLISYLVKSPATSTEPYENYTSQCERFSSDNLFFRFTKAQFSPTVSSEVNKPTTERSATPEDQLLNDSSRIEVEIPEEVKEDKDSFDPWRMVTLLRVVVVNIFLGLLIVALVMALTFVCYRSNFRYITIGREKKRETATKSDTATTLDAEKQSTEMQLLPQDGVISATPSSGNIGNSHENVDPEREPLQQQSNAYETTIFHFNRAHGESDDETMFCDSSTGVSSFLPHPPLRRSNGKQQNTESAYSSLDDEQADNGDYSEILEHSGSNKPQQDICETNVTDVRAHGQTYDVPKVIKSHNASCCKAQLTKENSIDNDRRCVSDQSNHSTSKHNMNNTLHHYQVNSVDYATITKLPGQRNCSPMLQNHANCSPNTISTMAEVQTHHHIHAVPEDNCISDSKKPSTVHLIPEHKCLLHKIPPPPPPPVKTPDCDNTSRTSCSTTQADV